MQPSTFEGQRERFLFDRCKMVRKLGKPKREHEWSLRQRPPLYILKTMARKSSGKSKFATERNSVSSYIKFLEFHEISKVYWMLFIRMIYVTVWSHQRVKMEDREQEVLKRPDETHSPFYRRHCTSRTAETRKRPKLCRQHHANACTDR